MGEANYYLKARFWSPGAAAAAHPKLAALLAEGERAYDYWQGSRPHSRGIGSPAVPTDEFWAGFREQFPLTVGYLGRLAGTADWNNGLAGQLGCLRDPGPDRPDGASLVVAGDLLRLRLNDIWHFTEMKLLERYCKKVLGAVAVGSLSDEELIDEYGDDDGDLPADLDPFEFLDV